MELSHQKAQRALSGTRTWRSRRPSPNRPLWVAQSPGINRPVVWPIPRINSRDERQAALLMAASSDKLL